MSASLKLPFNECQIYTSDKFTSDDQFVTLFNKAADHWGGSLEELEQSFYSLPKETRDEIDFSTIRKQIAQKQGIELREDVLASVGINPKIVWSAIIDSWSIKEAGQALLETKEVFKAKGLKLSKEDLFILDEEGRSLFSHRKNLHAFENFGLIVEILAENNERFTKQDCLFQRGHNPDLLKEASVYEDNNGINLLKRSLLNPDYWVGHSSELEDICLNHLEFLSLATETIINPKDLILRTTLLETGIEADTLEKVGSPSSNKALLHIYNEVLSTIDGMKTSTEQKALGKILENLGKKIQSDAKDLEQKPVYPKP